jgi:hypothetical protein
MPIWTRKFYINKIVEFKEEEKKAHDKEAAKIRAKTRK